MAKEISPGGAVNPKKKFTKQYQGTSKEKKKAQDKYEEVKPKKTSSTADKISGAFSSTDNTGVKETKNKITSLNNSGLDNFDGNADNSKKINHTTTVDKLKGSTTGTKDTGGTTETKTTTTKTTTPGTTPTTTSTATTTQAAPSTINVPLKEVEQATRREAEKVENYDPYADEQYNKQLEEYRQSIAGAYERQREESDLAYEKNKAAADRAALARGMGRSSYNLQTMANIDTEKAKARQTISDKEEEAAQQFGVQLASELRNNYQWQTAQNYQRERDTWSDYYQQQGLNQSQQQINMQQQQNAIANQQADRAYNYQVGRDQTSDNQWQQTFNYQQQRDKTSDEQWQKTFEQNQKIADQSQANTEKQYALGLIQYMAQNGGTPSDSLLKAAGISKKDYNAMKKKTKSSSKSSGSRGGTTPQQNPGTQQQGDNWYQTLLKWFS